MKMKYLMIVGLMLAILAVGAVSAADDAANMTADDSAQGDLIEETPEDDGNLASGEDYSHHVVVPSEVVKKEENTYDESIFVMMKGGDEPGNISAYVDDDETPFFNEKPIHVEGDVYSKSISFNGLALDYGSHNVLIKYSGDSKCPEFQSNHTFNVCYDLRYGSPGIVSYGDPAWVDVVEFDITGELTLNFNGKTYPLNSDNEYRCIIREYDLGVNNFTITLSNDLFYPDKTYRGKFTAKSEFKCTEVSGQTYGFDNKISLVLPEDANGIVNVTVDGKEYATSSFVDGKAVVSLSKVKVGEHIIRAEYTGADYDIKSVEISGFEVHPKINVPNPVYSGYENYTISVMLGENVTGNLVVKKNNDELYNGSINGTKSFNISTAEGNLRFEFTYDGVMHYYDYYNVYVEDMNPVWDMNITYPSSVLRGDRFVINVNVPNDYTQLFLYVDGKRYGERPYFERADIDTSLLEFGQHEFTVEAIDNYYIPQNRSGSFNVTFVEFDVPESFQYSDSAMPYVQVRSAEGVTGNVLVIIDGEEYAMEFLEGKKLEIPLGDLACGQHDYEVIYSGNHPQTSQNGTINLTYIFEMYVQEYVAYGDEIVMHCYLPYGAEGNVTLKIGNSTYVSEIYRNQFGNPDVKFDLPVLDVGDYLCEFTYNGDRRLNYAQSFNKTLSIRGYAILCPGYIFVGDDECMKLVLPENATGNLTVKVDDKPFANVCLKNGIAEVSLKNLTPGRHNISANYTGDDYAVSPLVAHIEVWIFQEHSEFVVINENGWISVILPANATGNVTIIFDGNQSTAVNVSAADIRNYTFKCDKLGVHEITLKYTGDDYDISLDPVIIGVEPKEIIFPDKNGGNEIVLVLPDDAKGNLTVYVNDHSKPFAQVNVTGPKASVSLADLNVLKEYEVKFVYEDEKYGTYSREFAYYPSKPAAEINISGGGDDKQAVFYIELPEDADGSLIIKINGQYYYRNLVDGKANVTINGLAPGDYPVNVEYSGGANYTETAAAQVITVNSSAPEPVPSPAKIVAGDLSVIYTAGTLYSVTVYAEGGELAKNIDVVIKIDGKKVAVVKTNDKGVATYKVVQVPGTYKITAEALGVTVTKKLTVKHVLKLKKVKVKRSAKKLKIKATLVKVNGKYLKNKKITLKFKNKKYTAKTNKKGVAKFTIKKKVLKKLKKGKKVTYKATYLKDTVKYTVKVKK